MRRKNIVALAVLGHLLGTAGCDSFLTGENLSEDPNQPTEASIQQLFVGLQAGQFAFQEGTVAMMMCMWVQQCGAGNARFVEQAGHYVFGESSNIAANNGDWLLVYAAGGLRDIREVEGGARAGGDSTWLGIAKIWEAFTIGTAAAMWGDLPYSQAGTSATPVLDHRFTILSALQTLLDEAIAELTGALGVGPASVDLVFGGNRAKWIATAWTLKARYHMHTAESLGTPAYQAAITAALNGINDATGAGDFTSFHSTKTSERNMWAQFQTTSGFGPDLVAGKALVDIMTARNDPRLAQYFCSLTGRWAASTKYTRGVGIIDPSGELQVVTAVAVGDTGVSGATQPVWATAEGATTVDGTVTWTNRDEPFGGDDFNAPQHSSTVSSFQCQPPRFADDASIPYVTYVENQLILAEAYNQTGDDGNALIRLNNARATVPLPALVGITGAALLDSIMTEKYVALFQNIESISDYRRTCIPRITPASNSQQFDRVPGRLFYPLNERNTNPNIPDPSVQRATHGFRNAGDVNPCPIAAP